jgi:outer membrane protein
VTYITKTLLAVGIAAALAAPVAQAEQGDWLFRGGATMVSPKSDNLKVDAGAAGVLVVEVDDATSFGFNVAYMMSDNWGIELLAAYPFTHDINASVQGVQGSLEVGEVEHLPPTLSLQYYFIPDGNFNPYVGLGVNWTMFSNEKLTSEFEDALFDIFAISNPKLQLDDSYGFAGQIGADVKLGDSWFVNFDIRYIQIEADAKIKADNDAVLPLGDIAIDPFVYSIMLGYRF